MSTRNISLKIYNKLAYNVGKFPSWIDIQKENLKEKIKNCKTCVEK